MLCARLNTKINKETILSDKQLIVQVKERTCKPILVTFRLLKGAQNLRSAFSLNERSGSIGSMSFSENICFRHSHSDIDHCHTLTHLVEKSAKNNIILFAVFIDLSPSFDSLGRN